ncbi:NADH-quinone oxidoreductase subunit N [Mycobacterium sp. PSTR-4-N]|uniref:NADH-quinone oxidoreductase subunit N n=1 Tax=Mycobacterium sp. PSTR-4-N TaxID=2917745 RepID=UPI001F14C0CE|nr:NADH-quinone oxidoreductase subunit N [Mycobacterium sp. PSTR-4-N]MCG7596243.1 NADH-quinone oxidoreductase subunit N [Mycobacterium sp. PSTR-4-N]
MLPELLIFGAGLLVLLSGSFSSRERQRWGRALAAAALIAAAAVAAVHWAGPGGSAFDGTFVSDTATGVVRVVAALGTLLALVVAGDELAGSARECETYALLLFATAGVLVLAGAHDLMVLAVGYLLASIPLYALIGLAGSARSAEAAMKAYLLGALFGILMLLGVTLLYGAAGTTLYPEVADRLAGAPVGLVAAGAVGVLGGLLFKAGAVPGHFWVPDAAQGSTGTAALFLTTVPKVGAVVAIYRLVHILPGTVAWPLLIAVLAVASMTLGNLAAMWQTDPRRLLGWSTVSQVGYLLVPVAVAGRAALAEPALLFYLAAYTLTNSAAFAVSTALPQARELASYRGLLRARPWLALALIVALLGLVGTPPTAVFVGKLTTTAAAWQAGAAWLAVVVFVNTLISLFYYLRWIVPAVQRTGGAFPAGRWSAGAAVVAAGLSLALGVAAGLAWPALSG